MFQPLKGQLQGFLFLLFPDRNVNTVCILSRELQTKKILILQNAHIN
jgi:hypothetical protein